MLKPLSMSIALVSNNPDVTRDSFAHAVSQHSGELQADGPGIVRDPTGQGATDKELLEAMDPRALWVQVQEAAGQGTC